MSLEKCFSICLKQPGQFEPIMKHMVVGCFFKTDLVHIWQRLGIEHDIKLCSDLLKFHKLSSQGQHDEQNVHIRNVIWTGHMVKAVVKSETREHLNIIENLLVVIWYSILLHVTTEQITLIRVNEWVRHCCLAPSEQFFSYIMEKTS